MALTDEQKARILGAVEALRKQGRRSASDFSCLYRSDNGDRCAIGHLIPDKLIEECKKYGERLEGRPWFELPDRIIKHLGLDPFTPRCDTEYEWALTALQRFHDARHKYTQEVQWSKLRNYVPELPEQWPTLGIEH